MIRVDISLKMTILLTSESVIYLALKETYVGGVKTGLEGSFEEQGVDTGWCVRH